MSGKFLYALRKRLKISSRELSRRAKVHESYVCKIEKDYTPTRRLALQIVRALIASGIPDMEAYEWMYIAGYIPPVAAIQAIDAVLSRWDELGALREAGVSFDGLAGLPQGQQRTIARLVQKHLPQQRIVQQASAIALCAAALMVAQ